VLYIILPQQCGPDKHSFSTGRVFGNSLEGL